MNQELLARFGKIPRAVILMILTVVSWVLYAEDIELVTLNQVIVADVLLVMLCLYDREKPINLFFLFMAELAVFHFGLVPVELLGLPVNTSSGYNLYRMYAEADIKQGLFLCLIGYNLMAFSGYCAKRQTASVLLPRESTREKDGVYRYGLFLFWVLLIPTLVYDLQILESGAQIGYMAKYEYDNSFLASMDLYFPMAIICIIAGGSKKNKWKWFYGFALVRAVLTLFILGNRGPVIIYLLVYELTRAVYQRGDRKKLKKGRVLLLVAAAILVVPFIAMIRGGGEGIAFLDYIKEYNAFSMFLSEFGSTLITPLLSLEYVETFGTLGGKTYAGGLATVIPFSQYFLADIRSYMNIGALLNPYSPLQAALGGSLFADMLINFGAWGMWMSVPIGILVQMLSDRIYQNAGNKKLMTGCLILYFGYGVLWYPRGAMQDIGLAVKRTLYMWIIYYMLKDMFIKKKRIEYAGIKNP